MNLKSFLDEAIEKGEQLKSDVVCEILKSKTLQELVGNQGFISAVTRIIETKDEVKRAIGQQIKSVFQIMDVPTKDDVKHIGLQLSKLEKLVDNLGRKRMAVRTLVSHKTKAKKKPAGKSAPHSLKFSINNH